MDKAERHFVTVGNLVRPTDWGYQAAIETLKGVIPTLPLEDCPGIIAELSGLTALAQLRIHQSAPSQSQDEHLVGVKEVAAMVGMSCSWVEKHTSVLPPRLSLHGKPRWRKRDVAQWIKTRPHYGKDT